MWATTKVNRKLKQLTPETSPPRRRNKAVEAGHRLKDRAVGFALDVRDNMAQREAELGEALGIEANPDRYPELPRTRGGRRHREQQHPEAQQESEVRRQHDVPVQPE